MDYKTQQYVVLALVLGLMVGVGAMVNKMQVSITGAAVTPICECSSNLDCDDSNICTKDLCLYPETCEASLCTYEWIC